MADHKLEAAPRTEFGKGFARRLRKADRIPAVIYGHGSDPVHISLPSQETFLVLRHANVLLEIAIEGQARPIMALPKQIQRDPLTGNVEHVDLLLVRAGEKVTVEVPLLFVGEAARDSMVNTDFQSLTVLAPATSIPSEIEVSVEGMQVGDQLTVGELKLPEGVETPVDPTQLLVNVVPPPTVSLEVPSEDDEQAEVGVVGDDSEKGSE